VIRVAQNDLSLYVLFQISDMQRLDSTQRAYGHKNRGLNLTMGGLYKSRTCVTFAVFLLECKLHIVRKFVYNFVGKNTSFIEIKHTFAAKLLT
jgi:hypothetical protein